MAVLASKRGISEMEFYKKATEIRKDAVALLMRNFGIKATNLFDTDLESTKWLIDFERNRIATMCASLVENIVKANNIYVYTDTDYEQKRAFQNLAIAEVYNLYEEFSHLVEVIPFEKLQRTFEKFIENCELELTLLKAWRKKTKKVSHFHRVENITKEQEKQVVQNNETTSEVKLTSECKSPEDADFFESLNNLTLDGLL